MINKGMKPITTVSFSLFGLQGLIGSAIAIGWKAIVENNSDNFIYVHIGEDSAIFILYGLICAGIGLGIGILSGLLVWIINNHTRENQFTDKTNWHW
jgi:hypothetical protein